MFRRHKRLLIASVVAVSVTITVVGTVLWPRVTIEAKSAAVAIEMGLVSSESNVETATAYQVLIPDGSGDITQLSSFGGENWFVTSSPTKSVVVYPDRLGNAPLQALTGISHNPNTRELIIHPQSAPLGWRNKGNIRLDNNEYTLEPGNSYQDSRGMPRISETKAIYDDHVYGTGTDLYNMEDAPQSHASEATSHIHGITSVTVYAQVTGTGRTVARLNGQNFMGEWGSGILATEYVRTPTGEDWTWEAIDALQAGIELQGGTCTYVYVQVAMLIGSQTFYMIDETQATVSSSATWTDVDANTYGVPSGATGVVLHIVVTGGSQDDIGWRKNGSTDGRTNYVYPAATAHFWTVVGIDGDGIFEMYVESNTREDIYIVGYTVTGVTMLTNGVDKSISSTAAWTDIDCSASAAGAIGLIFEVIGDNNQFGMRKNGSTDNRLTYIDRHSAAVIGCDASIICEGRINNTAMDFFLTGYITDGCTFNTNATNVSLAGTDTWTDLTTFSANTEAAFIEVITTSYGDNCGLRKDGSSVAILGSASADQHAWGIVECSDAWKIEGYITDTSVDFFVVGTAEISAAVPDISVSPTTYSFGTVQPSSTTNTTTSYFTITNSSTIQTDQTISVTTSNWSGGNQWTHSDTATQGADTAGLKSNRGGTWGTGDVIVKYSSPNYIYENCPASTNYSFGLGLWAPTSFSDGVVKTITVRISAAAG